MMMTMMMMYDGRERNPEGERGGGTESQQPTWHCMSLRNDDDDDDDVPRQGKESGGGERRGRESQQPTWHCMSALVRAWAAPGASPRGAAPGASPRCTPLARKRWSAGSWVDPLKERGEERCLGRAWGVSALHTASAETLVRWLMGRPP